ncbi:hypothetical protein AG1IA_04642 [Rhizoctonia solani AG-1 IA]|uniref:Uncharacterized protein n=1 Tax=Thanatephorus cucumeris (strain AG1-IA) TaxID=983506 RepID=L8WWX1_THACA|nr:hypothetical protein AG1IA_04642 [Rhizoctonia solani AG-1 IA]
MVPVEWRDSPYFTNPYYVRLKGELSPSSEPFRELRKPFRSFQVIVIEPAPHLVVPGSWAAALPPNGDSERPFKELLRKGSHHQHQGSPFPETASKPSKEFRTIRVQGDSHAQ